MAKKAIAHHPAKNEEKDQLAFRAWRRTLGEYQSASLHAMSTYLSDKGAYLDARYLLLEAKRLNYAPECRPDDGLWSCIMGILRVPSADMSERPPLGAALASEQFEVADQEKVDYLTMFKRGADASMLLLLSPGGYGAKPELALLWILAAVITFFLIYVSYSFFLRLSLAKVPGLRSQLPQSGPARQTTGVNADGLEENPQAHYEPEDAGASSEGDDDAEKVDPLDDLLEDLINHWPDEQNWRGWETGQRLHQIQKILLPRIEACQKEAPEPMLTNLSVVGKKLERFGSTEKLGFSLFDGSKRPTRFTHWRYSIDTMVPFIDLHAYTNYYPESSWMRLASVVQHVVGWWLISVFIASAAIL